MNKQLISEVGRINDIMGTRNLLVEQAAIIKWLRLLLGVTGKVAKLTFKEIAVKIPQLTDAFVNNIIRAGILPVKGRPKKGWDISTAKTYIARGFNDLLTKGKKLNSATAEILVRLARENDDMYKLLSKELLAKAEGFQMKIGDILQNNELRVQFQKLLMDPQIGLNLKRAIPDDILSRMADDFIKNGGKLKALIGEGWWKKVWSKMDDIDLARIYGIDAIFVKFLPNKSYFNVRNFIKNLADPATSKKLLEGTPFKSADELAEVVTEALSKGKQLGRVELEALTKLIGNTQKYRAVLYEAIGQSSYIKAYIRDIPVHKIKESAVDDFFLKAIGSTDPNDLVKFKNSLGFAWDPFRKRTWQQLIDPITWKYTFIKAKDIFFSPARYPKFTKWYWLAMGSTAIINYITSKMNIDWLSWLPVGETKAEAGLKEDFYMKLEGAKTLVLDEGGLDDEQAKTIAQMLNNLLNYIFDMEHDFPDLYLEFTAYTRTSEAKAEGVNFELGDFKGVNIENLSAHREIFKAFSDWIDKIVEDGTYAPAASFVTGVSDQGVQDIYKNMIPTVLAASQVTHFYDHGIHQSHGALHGDLEKLQPIIHWLPIPIFSRTFGDGIQEIYDILEDMQWMKSVTKGEMSLSEILDVAISEWPTFPETLSGSTGKLWCKWSGHIPPDALATLMDGTEAGKAAQPAFIVGEDQQNWLDELTAQEFNRAFCLAAEGTCIDPYGWTKEEMDSGAKKVQESKAALTEHMKSFFMDLKHIKELMMANPDKLCEINRALCELLGIIKDAHKEKVDGE